MEGACGVFYADDKQIGGCFGWRLSYSKQHRTDRVLARYLMCDDWWFFERVQNFLVRLFLQKSDGLVLIQEFKVNNTKFNFELGKRNKNSVTFIY